MLQSLGRRHSRNRPFGHHRQVPPHLQELFGETHLSQVNQTPAYLSTSSHIDFLHFDSKHCDTYDHRSTPHAESTSAKMLSRTARAVSRGALATSLRPIAVPVVRQLAPQVARPQRRQYHEKVLDRESPSVRYQSFSERLPLRTWLTYSGTDYSRPRNVGTLDKSDSSVGEGLVGAPAVRTPSRSEVQEQSTNLLVATVRRRYAAPYQGRPRDTGHQRCPFQDIRMRLCDVRTHVHHVTLGNGRRLEEFQGLARPCGHGARQSNERADTPRPLR